MPVSDEERTAKDLLLVSRQRLDKLGEGNVSLEKLTFIGSLIKKNPAMFSARVENGKNHRLHRFNWFEISRCELTRLPFDKEYEAIRPSSKSLFHLLFPDIILLWLHSTCAGFSPQILCLIALHFSSILPGPLWTRLTEHKAQGWVDSPASFGWSVEQRGGPLTEGGGLSHGTELLSTVPCIPLGWGEAPHKYVLYTPTHSYKAPWVIMIN